MLEGGHLAADGARGMAALGGVLSANDLMNARYGNAAAKAVGAAGSTMSLSATLGWGARALGPIGLGVPLAAGIVDWGISDDREIRIDDLGDSG